jgi:LmbE family N-acetylglucosaminyl deacetylase
VQLIVDGHRTGTPEESWVASQRLRRLPTLETQRPRRVVVLSPHPDDEIFGAAGLIQSLLAQHVPVDLVAVSDGEASHPLAVAGGLDLRAMRARESERARRRLAWSPGAVTRLGLPDGRVGQHLDSLIVSLRAVLSPGDLCLAPWWRDGHPDHDACGTAARVATLAQRAHLLGYLVWAWHWADPEGTELPWADCRRFDFDRRTAARKRWATGAYASQTRPLGPDRDGAPVLPPAVLRRFWRPYEVFVDSSGEIG